MHTLQCRLHLVLLVTVSLTCVTDCRRFTGKDRDTDGFTDGARDEKQPRHVKTSHPPIPPLPDKLTVPYDHYPPLPDSPPVPDAYSPLPDVSTLPDEEFSPLARGRRVQSRGWRRRAADGRAIKRYLGRHAGVAMSAQLLRRILQREARRHSMWKGILQRLEKQQQLTPQPQDDDWSHDPKLGSWGLDSWSKPRETESKGEEEEEEEEEGDVSAYTPSVKERYLNMIRSKLLRQGTRKGKKAYSRAPRPERTKPEMDPESAEQGPPLDDLYPFLDKKDAVSFFSSPATVSKRRRWLQKLIRMVKAHGSLDKKFDDDVSSDYEDIAYGEDTVDKDEQEDVFDDSDESKDDDEHSDEDSNEDMSDSQESSSDSDEVDDSSNERLADDVDDVGTESVDDREKGVLAFHGRASPARRTSARRLPQIQRLMNYRGKPRVGRRQQRLQHRRRQQALRRRKLKPTRRIPHVRRLPPPRKLPAQRRLPNARKLPGRRRFFPSRRRSTPAARKPPPARKLQPRGKPPTTRLHPSTRPPPPVRRPLARSPIWRWRQTGRRGNRRGRLHSRHRGAGARKQNRFGANAGPPRTRHTSSTTRATTRTANDNDSTLMTTPPARLQWTSPADSDARNSDPSTGGNRDRTGTSPDESTAFSETETKPTWTVSDEAKPETSAPADLTDGTAEEAELPAVLPDAEDGPDATPDFPGEVGDAAGQMPDLEAVSTVYLGAVEGRRVKATRLDVLKEPLADHDTDRDGSDHHAAPVFLRVQYKPANHGSRERAVGSLQRKRRNIDNDDVDAMDNNDDSVDNRNTSSEDDNDGNDDDDNAHRRNRRRRRWRTGGRNQRRRHDADNVSDGDEDDESDNNGDDEDAVRSASQRRRQEWRRRRYRGNRRRQRVRIETDNDEDNRKDRNDGSLGFIQIVSSSNNQERESRQSRRRDDSRRNHRRRNRNGKRRKNRRLQQQQRQHAAAGEAEGDDDVGDERPTRDDPPPYLPQIQTINNNNNDNGNDSDGESEAYIRSPFINHRTAYDFLSTQARSRPQGHATSGRGSNEQRREQWQFSHTMSESMCEVFDKHFVPTSVGGRCE